MLTFRGGAIFTVSCSRGRETGCTHNSDILSEYKMLVICYIRKLTNYICVFKEIHFTGVMFLLL